MRVALLAAVATLTALAACTQQTPRPMPIHSGAVELTAAAAEARAEHVRRDPVAYLREVYLNCVQLEKYKLLFIRQERRGLLRTLTPPERIETWFRRSPFSVRMRWLDEDVKYGESVYVRGQEGDRVRFVTRRWSPPLLPPPQVNRVDVHIPALFGEARRPITEFGLELLMERTLAAYMLAREDAVVVYEGVVTHEGTGRRAHALRLEYNPAKHPVPTQEIFVDAATDLPLATVLRLPGGQIDAAYTYAQVETDVELTDDDFLLPQERKQLERGDKGGSS